MEYISIKGSNPCYALIIVYFFNKYNYENNTDKCLSAYIRKYFKKFQKISE